MILRDLPDLPPRPPTRANAAFRRWFYERWGRENAVIVYRTHRAEFVPHTQALSIKRAWGGAEDYLVGSQRLAVSDSHGLILNDGAHYGARISSPTPVTSLAVFFRPGMAEELAGAAAQAASKSLDHGPSIARAAWHFSEHLRVFERGVEERLARLLAGVCHGETDDAWLEEQLQGVLWAMLHAEPGWRERSRRLQTLSRSAHAELQQRVDRAADFILSCYTEPITLDQIAAAAGLSKYHLVRCFAQVHGVTPMALLTRTRTRAAERLLRETTLSMAEVLARSGFGSRQTLFRQLRRLCGAGGRELRQRASRLALSLP
ncbi:MAG: AraC family transcriptional regulator [Burkholderiaceae bacterium]